MRTRILRLRTVEELRRNRGALLDAETLDAARAIVDAVARDGEPALLEFARRFGDWDGSRRWWFDRGACERARTELDPAVLADLEDAAARITAFAEAQRSAIREITVAVPGGRAGHTLVPLERAGCYVPAGRYPLPSSLLMTAITARVAGVQEIWIATPNPSSVMLAAAAVAGADGVLGIGGAQAIGALAHGAGPVPACDAIVGPGNRWVTAAKQCVAGRVNIDMLAGPSAQVVLAHASAEPQAEHDPDAMPVLVTAERSVVDRVEEELERQIETLPARAVACEALASGGVVVVTSLDEGIAAVDAIAPEHLQLAVADPDRVAGRVRHAGALFLGEGSAEVFGDYGAGPNHVLPTGGGARSTAGLSVLTFLRARTWLRIDDPGALAAQAARLARLEGLEGHARAAEAR